MFIFVLYQRKQNNKVHCCYLASVPRHKQHFDVTAYSEDSILVMYYSECYQKHTAKCWAL